MTQDSQYVNCKRCHGKIDIMATKCLHCGVIGPVAGTETKAKLSSSNIINIVAAGFCLAIFAGLYACVYESDEEKLAKEQARSAKAAADKKAGFHCLSGWDGSHREVVSAVKSQLRDPSSFEHVQTRITPMSESGEHRLTMTYRAKNGFGALTGGLVEATVRNATCSAQVVSID